MPEATMTREKFVDRLFRIPALAAGEHNEDFEIVQTYLKKFGYIDKDIEPAKGTLDLASSAALTKFQKFFGIPVTGEFDKATRLAMSRPRCAVPDMPAVAFRTIGPWNRRQITYA